MHGKDKTTEAEVAGLRNIAETLHESAAERIRERDASELAAYIHRGGCGGSVRAEVHPGYEFNDWKMVCKRCGEFLDGHEVEAIRVVRP